MRFKLITGPVMTVTCHGCNKSKTSGTEPYETASRGTLVMPEIVYQDLDTSSFYCQPCAASVVESADPTRSISQFYVSTRG